MLLVRHWGAWALPPCLFGPWPVVTRLRRLLRQRGRALAEIPMCFRACQHGLGQDVQRLRELPQQGSPPRARGGDVVRRLPVVPPVRGGRTFACVYRWQHSRAPDARSREHVLLLSGFSQPALELSRVCVGANTEPSTAPTYVRTCISSQGSPAAEASLIAMQVAGRLAAKQQRQQACKQTGSLCSGPVWSVAFW